MARVIGITELENKKYNTYDLGEQWTKHLGKPEKGFSMHISGYSSNGKTNLTVIISKVFAMVAKVDYNSFEEGHESTMQEVSKRHNLKEVAGKIMWLDRFTYEELIERASKKNSSNIIVIDSADDMNFTYAKFLAFRKKFPKKSLIVVSKGNEKTGEPIWTQGKKIKFKCQIKCIVKNFIATFESRYGGNEKFIIRDKKAEAGAQYGLEL